MGRALCKAGPDIEKALDPVLFFLWEKQIYLVIDFVLLRLSYTLKPVIQADTPGVSPFARNFGIVFKSV